jgi:ABC-type transporter Mla MlaB component
MMVICGAIADGDATALCSQVARLLDGLGASTLVCDVHGLEPADAAAVDGLARMQLTALRRGHRIQLDRPPRELRDLIALVGLGEVLPSLPPEERARPSARGRRRRQAEQRKQGGGVEEGGEADHPAV